MPLPGHCGLAEDELLVQAEKLLEIPFVTLAEVLQAELATGEVVADLISTRRCIFLAHLWRAERLIAHRLETDVRAGRDARLGGGCSALAAFLYDTRHATKVANAFSGDRSGFSANSKIETLSKLT